jgi:RNA polymerase primary sigma factor
VIRRSILRTCWAISYCAFTAQPVDSLNKISKTYSELEEEVSVNLGRIGRDSNFGEWSGWYHERERAGRHVSLMLARSGWREQSSWRIGKHWNAWSGSDERFLVILRALSTLTPREAEVIMYYFRNVGETMTLEEIGEKSRACASN